MLASSEPLPLPAGTAVRVTSGKFAGRTGKVARPPTRTFADFRHVELDPAPRERTKKVEFIAVESLWAVPLLSAPVVPTTHALSYVSHPRDPDARAEAFAMCGHAEECSGSGKHSFLRSAEGVTCRGCLAGLEAERAKAAATCGGCGEPREKCTNPEC